MSNKYTAHEDVASGKEWIQWTETTGMSVNDDFSSLSGGGWRVASNADMAVLFGDFFSSVAWDTDENTSQSNDAYTSFGDGIDQSLVFGNIFGWTDVNDSHNVLSGNRITNYVGLHRTYAWFGDDSDSDGLINGLFVESEHTWESFGVPYYFYTERAELYSDTWITSSSNSRVGIALVRDILAVEVPEPSTLALLALGIVGLGVVRKKSQA